MTENIESKNTTSKENWFWRNQIRIANFMLGLCLFLTIAVIVEQYWLYTRNTSDSKPHFSKNKTKKLRKPMEYVVDTPGCKIPLLDPHDSSISSYIMNHSVYNLNCNLTQLFYMNGKILEVNSDELSKLSNVKCGYVPLSRVTDFIAGYDFPIRWINGSTLISDEFIRVLCFASASEIVYQDFFALIHQKPEVECRVRDTLAKMSPEEKQRLNVLLIGIGSASKNHYRRHLLKTDSFIRDHLTYADFFGYNKLDLGTVPNILPLLTGTLEKDYNAIKIQKMLDYLPLIWKESKLRGYRTLFAEDSTANSLFNGKWRRGFEQQQTDYSMRPFTIEFDKNKALTNDLSFGCYRNRSEATAILQWMEDFFDKFKGDPLFATIFLSRLSRRNYTSVALYDQSLLNSLKMLHSKGHFNNTVVIFFSDEGFYHREVRKRYIGNLEDKLPFLLMIFPPWFSTQYPQFYLNAKLNERRLVTPLDVHATLSDILDNFSRVQEKASDDNRSVSLFTQISEYRTCRFADVHILHCSCSNEQYISNNSNIASEIGWLLVNYINKLATNNPNNLGMLRLSRVRKITAQNIITKIGKEKESYATVYKLVIVVGPNSAIYQGKVSYTGLRGHYKVNPDVRRLYFIQ